MSVVSRVAWLRQGNKKNGGTVMKFESLLFGKKIGLAVCICLLAMALQSRVTGKDAGVEGQVVDSGKDVAIVLWGDSRENVGNATVNTLKVLQEDIRDWDIMIHTGDFTSNGSAKTWEKSLDFQGMRDVFVQGRFFMCTSNHDKVRRTYDKYTQGVLPVNEVDNTTHFYHHQQGNVHIFFCDAQFTKPAVVNTWLEAELKAIPPEDWIIGVWHAPCYGDVTYKPSYLKACQAWLDTLHKYGGDLVFHGDAHTYLRTYPLLPDGVQDLENGMVHIINGTGGASFTRPPKKVEKTAFTPDTKSFPTVTMLRFQGSTLMLKTIDTRPGKDLAVIDAWIWQKHPKGGQVGK
ncbi:MAG: metallophosphoesterase [Phycisphaerae bacterium]|nr:metallophosphoesterase [Phycisphaerae bacterium]